MKIQQSQLQLYKVASIKNKHSIQFYCIVPNNVTIFFRRFWLSMWRLVQNLLMRQELLPDGPLIPHDSQSSYVGSTSSHPERMYRHPHSYRQMLSRKEFVMRILYFSKAQCYNWGLSVNTTKYTKKNRQFCGLMRNTRIQISKQIILQKIYNDIYRHLCKLKTLYIVLQRDREISHDTAFASKQQIFISKNRWPLLGNCS
jgi:hypothetical protein